MTKTIELRERLIAAATAAAFLIGSIAGCLALPSQSYAATAGSYTTYTWDNVGEAGLSSVAGYALGTTGTDCDQYVKAAINQKYGMSVACNTGGVGNLEDNYLRLYGEAVAGGTRSNPYSWGSIKPGDIVIFYASNGSRCHAAIVGEGGALYHGGVHAAGVVVREYNISSWMDANISSGSGIDSASYTAYRLLGDKGWLKLKKSTHEDYKNADYLECSTYSLKGAKYGVYAKGSDAASDSNRLATFTTDANGDTNTVELTPGTYFIKELSPSPGYMRDELTYSATVTSGQTTTFNVSEVPDGDPISAIIKQNADDIGSTKNLEGAQFTIKYYDVDSSTYTNLESIADLTPKKTWTFETAIKEGKSVAYFSEDYLVAGSDAMYHSIYGTPTIPVGVYTVEETLAPKGFARDETVLYGKVYYDAATNSITDSLASGGGYTIVGGTAYVKDEPQHVTVSVKKVDAETGASSPASELCSLAGAEYEVYKYDPATGTLDDRVYVGKIVTDEHGEGALAEDSDGNKLLPGTYYVTETKASKGYMLNDETITVKANATERNTAVFHYTAESEEKAHHAIIRKVDEETGDAVPLAKLQILDSDGNVVSEFTSDTEATDIAGLPEGKYTLHEVEAPEGYEKAEDIEFEVTADKQNVEVTMKDKAIKVEPVNPEPAEPTESAEAIDTGDHRMLLLYGVTFAMSIALIATLIIRREKMRRNDCE